MGLFKKKRHKLPVSARKKKMEDYFTDRKLHKEYQALGHLTGESFSDFRRKNKKRFKL